MTVRILLATLALGGLPIYAQQAQMVVTVADHSTHKPADLKPADVKIFDANITDWRRLEARDLELYVVVDDAANYDFTSKLRELRNFVTSQPPEVSIGLAYIHDGALQIVAHPMTDRTALLHSLRAPSGSRVASPYCALTDLISQWPRKSVRREIVLVSAGIDDSASEGAVCVNAEMAIQDAERAGVQVFALYNPGEGYQSASWSRVDSGLTELGHVCYETGGEAYFIGNEAPESIVSWLQDISEHLANQYLVTFRMMGTSVAGFQKIFLLTGPSNPELMVPDSVWVSVAGK
jgi:hypothetical protein